MKIYIDQISDAGLELTESCPPTTLDLDRSDIKVTEPIKVSAQITKGINNISVNLKIDAALHLTCNRCLEEFVFSLSRKATLNFPIENKTIIDFTDNLREEIMLSYPLQPLCRADCLGLCPVCGKNLNEGKCNCRPLPKA